MLYPRVVKLNGKDVLVDDNQCVGYKEHMAQNYRILFLNGAIGMKCLVCGAAEIDTPNLLMAMDKPPYDPIKLIIQSPGGDLDSTLLFYDTMKLLKSPIITVGRYCASAAALLLAAGSKRYLYSHAKVMLHRPWGRQEGDSRDLEIQNNEMKKYQSKFLDALIKCGVDKTPSEIIKDIDRNLWLEPTEAISYGLADEVFTPEIWQSWIKEDIK